jgi:hypothetical protein
MMLRRCLVFAGLLFWHGGATCYAGVVIQVGLRTLDPPALQTFVTRTVTLILNLTGAVALGLFAWDVAAVRDVRPGRRRARWTSCAGMLLSLIILAWLHSRLDRLMDVPNRQILDRAALRPLHHLYISISGLQWVCASTFALLTLCAWRAEEVGSHWGCERLSIHK